LDGELKKSGFAKKNNLNYKVVPGITSALGAASIFGIPLTQRGKNSTVLFGHWSYCEGEFCDTGFVCVCVEIGIADNNVHGAK
jgi:siroheme synthase